MDKPVNNRAWFLVVPVVAIVAFNAVLPLMTVINYSVQDTFGNNQFFWNGVGWYKDLLDPSSELGGRFLASLVRNAIFSLIVLLIEVPLGHSGFAVHAEERAGRRVLPGRSWLCRCWFLGMWWAPSGRSSLAATSVCSAGPSITLASTTTTRPDSSAAWFTIIVMDVWHWTSLIALLCYAGLKSIPDAFYQAARIDGASRWAVFRAIELPKLRHVLLIGVLLRFMDSFMIYTEPFVVTGGGPGNSTTVVSIELVKIALGQFDLGKAAAMSIVYDLIILVSCWIFYTVMTNTREVRRERLA